MCVPALFYFQSVSDVRLGIFLIFNYRLLKNIDCFDFKDIITSTLTLRGYAVLVSTNNDNQLTTKRISCMFIIILIFLVQRNGKTILLIGIQSNIKTYLNCICPTTNFGNLNSCCTSNTCC